MASIGKNSSCVVAKLAWLNGDSLLVEIGNECGYDIATSIGFLLRNKDTTFTMWTSVCGDTLSIDLSSTASIGIVGTGCRHKKGRLLQWGQEPILWEFSIEDGQRFYVSIPYRSASISRRDINYVALTTEEETVVIIRVTEVQG
jgi:hypothetical protein